MNDIQITVVHTCTYIAEECVLYGFMGFPHPDLVA